MYSKMIANFEENYKAFILSTLVRVYHEKYEFIK